MILLLGNPIRNIKGELLGEDTKLYVEVTQLFNYVLNVVIDCIGSGMDSNGKNL